LNESESYLRIAIQITKILGREDYGIVDIGAMALNVAISASE
jgi:hypothetical protein